jgi:hypothetical protein
MPQQADFGGFYYDWDSNLLAYRAVTAVICQRLPQPLCELPTLTNTRYIRSRVIDKSAGSEDPVLTSMGVLLYDCSFKMADF